MDVKLILKAFAAVFVLEMGDKTQLAVFTMGAQSGRMLEIFIGSSAALIATTLIGVLLGKYIGGLIPERYLNYVAGGVFILIGLYTIIKGD